MQRARARTSAGGLPRTFWVLCLGLLVNRAGSFVVPFMSVYLTQARGYSIATAGMVAGLPARDAGGGLRPGAGR